MRKIIYAALLAVIAVLVLSASAQAAGPPLSLERADSRAAHEAVEFRDEWNTDTLEFRADDALLMADSQQYLASLDPASPTYAEDVAEEMESIADFLADPDPLITGFDRDSCERATARQAECDLTWYFEDGNACDETLTIRTTRRNRLAVSTGVWSCDHDA